MTKLTREEIEEARVRLEGWSVPTIDALCDMALLALSAEADARECICKGNWRAIVKETAPFIGKRYRDHRGDVFTFYGIVHGDDDYYYGMYRKGECVLLSCVGSIENHGYEPMEPR